MEPYSGVRVKGYFIKFDIDRVKKNLGNNALARLQSQYGKPLTFYGTQYYPVEEEVKILEIIGKLFYPSVSAAEMWERLGADDASTFLNSQFGKIVASFILPDLKQGLKNIAKLFSMVHEGMICEPNIEAYELNIPNNPYPPTYYKGFFEEVIRRLGKPNHVVVEVGPGKCLYKLAEQHE